MAPLSGMDGAQALRVYTGLGALDARFDAGRVAAAVRSRAGRVRLAAAIAVARVRLRIRPERLLMRPRAWIGQRGTRRARRTTRLARSGGRSRPHRRRSPARDSAPLLSRLGAPCGGLAGVG